MSSIECEECTKRIRALSISEKKKQNFLTTDDPNKYQTRFFNRNLRDTAYATKELVTQVHLFNEYLKTYLKGENIGIKTLSTPGQLTHKIRTCLLYTSHYLMKERLLSILMYKKDLIVIR